MKQFTSGAAAMALAAALAWPAVAGADAFSGTRSNISPGGELGGRCGDSVLTISFSPSNFSASGTSNLGSFVYHASHCIAAPPPGSYFDGLFSWDFGDGLLNGSYTGELTAAAQPGSFNVVESISFTGGTGRFAGASGSASASALGELNFGQFDGNFASFSEVTFNGTLNLPAVPEPATWALLSAGALLVASVARRRRAAGQG